MTIISIAYDDIEGARDEQVPACEEVPIFWRGHWYLVQLGVENSKAFDEAMRPWVEHARKLPQKDFSAPRFPHPRPEFFTVRRPDLPPLTAQPKSKTGPTETPRALADGTSIPEYFWVTPKGAPNSEREARRSLRSEIREWVAQRDGVTPADSRGQISQADGYAWAQAHPERVKQWLQEFAQT